MQVGVDSCCTNTLLPPSFDKFILKRNVGERLHIMLAAKGQEMDAGNLNIFKIPVIDTQGNKQFMIEK